jgi:hypothetical protein
MTAICNRQETVRSGTATAINNKTRFQPAKEFTNMLPIAVTMLIYLTLKSTVHSCLTGNTCILVM